MTPDHEAERMVLGAILTTPSALAVCEELLKADHFEHPQHKRIFASMLHVSETGGAVDVVSLLEDLRQAEALEDAGGRLYVHGLDEGMPRVTNVHDWAMIVREKARRRALVTIAERLVSQANDSGNDTDSLIDRHSAALSRLSDSGGLAVRHVRAVMPEAIRGLESFSSAPGGIVGVPTGIVDLDRMTSGMRNGELWVVAARPGRGKSVMCAQLAVHAAQQGHKVLLFPLEMAPEQVGERMILSESSVRRWDLRAGGPGAGWEKVGKAAGRLSELPLWFDQRETATVTQLRATARRHRASFGLDLIIVDYLQRLTFDTKSERWIAVGDAAKGLKSLARSMDVPVLVACQLNAEGEEKRPTMANLGQSAGIIGAEADVIGLIHPEEVNNWRNQPYPAMSLFLDKNRRGETGTVNLSFDKAVLRFHGTAKGES